MKKITLILIMTLLLTSCYNYRDVNRVVFVTALCIDIDENNNPVLYAEAFTSIRGAEETTGREARLVFTGTGETVFEAIRSINRTSAHKLNYTQNKAVIFSKEAAEYGLDQFLDVLIRDQELLVRQYLYIADLDVKELINLDLDEQMFTGIFLHDLTENKPNPTRERLMRIDEFYVNRKLGSKINGLSLVTRADNPFIQRLTLEELAVMKEDKMIGILDADETFLYNIMKNNLAQGYITVANPDEPEKLISLEILSSKTKTKTKYNDGNTVDVTKEVSLRTTVAEIQESFHLNDLSDRKLLRKNAETKIKNLTMDLFEEYKKEDIDLYDLKRHVDIKYPNANLDEKNFLDYVNFDIQVDVFLEGSTDVVNFY